LGVEIFILAPLPEANIIAETIWGYFK